MANNDLQLEYGVKFDVKTGGANATAEIKALSDSWQALLDKQKLVIKMGAEAEKYTNNELNANTSNKKVAQNEKVNSTLKEMSEYYKELEARAKNFYNANQSDKNAALDGMKKRLEQIKKEMSDIEYNLIGITEKKKPRADTTVQLNWIEDLKKEAAGIQAAMASLSNLNMGGAPANVQKLNSELTTTNFTLLQMREYYKQVEAENAKLAKNALSKTNTKDVLGMKEGSIEEIEKKIQRLNQSMQIFSNTASKVGMNDEKLNGAFRKANDELNRLQQKLATLQAGFGNRSLNSLLQINPKSIQEANALMAELARRRDALNRTDPGYANSISSINKKQAELSAENARALGISEQKTKAINNETAAFDKQSTVISNLRNMAATYLSIYEAGRLIKNIAEITGQFELQEKSLAAIIQSADKANEIFGQVKNLAVISPFKFSELLSYTKQLAAYRVETDQLYDTMKNLADVSAGLGVDMSRIILAYGQVRAASVLRGQELRQFTEAGIPLVALLADKFTELEGRVVSTGEVFGKISERMVSFEMVKDIFADMSGEGGMFYNMQEIQADTLAGKISNLTDAYQIMFASIGGDETLNGVLKGTIDLVTRLARNWRELWDVAKFPIFIFSGFKTAQLALVGYQSLTSMFYAKNMAYQQAAIGMNDREVASLARKTAFQEASLVANKAKIASDSIMNFTSAQTIAMDKREIVSKSIKLAVLKAGTDATKVANLQNEISIILTTAGVSKDKAAAIARLGLAVATNTATAATITFGSTVKAIWAISPVGWVLAFIAALISVGYWLTSGSRAAKAFEKELSKIGTAGTNEAIQLVGRFKTLSETARDSTKSLKEQNDALSTLKQVYGDILPDYMLTIEGLTEIKDNYDKVTSAIEANIAVKTKEKKITAISDNYEEKTNPIIDGLKTDLTDLGVDSILASQAVAELIKRINEGTVKSKSSLNELVNILYQINGTDLTLGEKSTKRTKNLYELDYGTTKLTKSIYEQKKAIEALNQTTPPLYEAFAAKAAAIAGEVKKATESIIKGEKKDDEGKIVVFDESIYQFNERKANVERESLIKHIEATTGKAFEAVQSSMAKNGGKDMNLNFGVLNWLEDSIKRASELDTSPVQKKVNEIIERTAKAQGLNASQYDLYAYKGTGADGGDGFSFYMEEHDKLIKKIQQTKDANNDWATNIIIKAKDVANGYRQITKEEYLNGYMNGDKKIAGLNQQLATINAIKDAWGLADKDAKKPGGTTAVNPRIAAIEAEIALVEQAKKKYEELVKAGKSPEQSKTIVDNLYKDQFKLKNKKGEILFKPVFDEKELIGSLKTAKTEFQKISKTEKQVFSVGLKTNESEIKIFTDEMKAALSAIEKEFATNKKRIDLFNTLFETTGDSNLAKKLAESIEGAGTVDLELALNKSFEKAFESLKIDTKPLFDKMGNVDISAAQKEIDKLDPTSETRVQAQKQLDIVKEFRAKEISELIKRLSDFGTYQERRTKIVRDAEVERLKIASRTLPKEAIDSLLVSNENKKTKDLSKLAIENFKDSDMWQVVFSDLDKVSNESIALLKDRVEDFIKEAGKGFDPTEMREMVKSLETLKDRLKGVKTKDLLKDIFSKPDLAPLKAAVDEAKKEYDKLLAAKDAATIKNTNAADSVIAAKRTQDPTKIKDAEDAQVAANSELIESDKKLTSATKKLTDAQKEYQETADKRKKATHAAIKQNNEYVDAVKAVKDVVDAASDAFYQMADVMGLTVSDETRAIIDGISKGLGALIAILGVVSAMLFIIDSALAPIIAVIWPLIVAFAALGLAFAIFKEIKLGGINRELKEQAKIVEGLEKRYSELEKSMEKALGVDWIKDYNEQMENLSTRAKGLQVQIDLSRKKGKDENEDDTKDLVDKLEDVNSLIADASSKLQNYLVGTDLTSAAKDFASAWLDAYKSFGSTTDAMKVKFKDMMSNLAVNMLLSKGFERLLAPVFDMLELEAKKGELTSEGWNNILQLMDKTIPNLDAWGRAITQKFDFKSLQDSTENLNGLSKGISGITEDTALLLGGYLDSIRFRIFAYFDAMAAMPTFDMKSSMATLMTAQNTQISHLEGIKSNTLRSAIASENLSAKIDSVIAVSTAGSGYAIKVNA